MTAQSESIKNLMADLLLVQQAIKPAIKDAKNPFYKSDYADLSSVIRSCKDALSSHNVVVLQPIAGDYVETMLIHSITGEFITSSTKIVCSKLNDPQAYGSAVTYARRYGLTSMLVIETTDDDAEGAMDRSEPERTEHYSGVTVKKCPLCGTTNQFHKPGCLNARPETRI